MGDSAGLSDATEQVIGQLDYQGDDATRETVVAVLLRLPEGVRTFALERCSFVAAADTATQKSPDRSDRHRVVLHTGVDEAAVQRAIAEAWLNQDGADDTPAEDTVKVDELVAQWEFTGPGADA